MKRIDSARLPRASLAGMLLLALGLATLGLASCATQETPPATQIELDAASELILHEAVYVNTILDSCARLSTPLADRANELRRSWQDHNGSYLAAADAHFSARLSPETLQYRGVPLALEAVKLSHQNQERAHDELRLQQRSATNQRIVCERHLNTLNDDLQRIIPEQGPRSEWVLDTLISSYPQASASLATAPTLGAHVAPNQESSRSYYQLVEQEQATCPNLVLRVIDNQWPHEAYGAYCESVPYALIECQWGECRHR